MDRAIKVPVSEAERALIATAAKRAKKPVAAWLRELAIAAASELDGQRPAHRTGA